MKRGQKHVGNKAVATAVSEGLEGLRGADGRPLTLERAAKRAKVSIASLTGWKAGVRIPSPAKARQLARAFYPKDQKGQRKFIETIEGADLGPRPPADPLEGLIRDPTQKLEIRIVRSGALAGRARPDSPADWGFLSELIERYCSHAGLHRDIDTQSWDEGLETLKSGRIRGILTGIVATADRLKHASFFATPITVPVNAVISTHHLRHRAAARRQLGEGARGPDGDPVRLSLFTFQDEIGEIYVRRTCGLESQRLGRENEPQWRVVYEAAGRAWKGDEAVPLIVADELTCARIIKALGGKGELLVSPGEDSFFPSYLVGLATNRRHVELSAFFRESLELFLVAEETWVVRQLEELRSRLVKSLSSSMGPGAKTDVDAWVKRLLGASHLHNDVISPAWRAILKRFFADRKV